MTHDMYERVEAAAAAVRSKCQTLPQTAVVLGSGLGDFADTLLDAVSISYADVPHWPASNVVGHTGRLVVGSVAGRPIAALAGRAHFYEGHDLSTVVFATRVMGRLGARQIILTNAAGGINTAFASGALMVIDDHINLLGSNPLLGVNDERFGPRFPDMSEAYSAELRALASSLSPVPLREGVYAGVLGPSFETPAEIRYLRSIGADLVGMSTVSETIAANHAGMRVLGISCVTNMAAGVLDQPLSHEEVVETAARVRETFMTLVTGIVAKLPNT